MTGYLNIEQFKKEEFILREGQIARKLWFVENGLVRIYQLNDGKEEIKWFANEGDFVTSMYSFISQKTGYDNIQALEETSMVSITYQNLQTLYKIYPSFERVGRLISEQYFVLLEEHALSLRFRTAKERYENLLKTEVYLLQKVSLGFIASYLGITQETLSRIRGKK